MQSNTSYKIVISVILTGIGLSYVVASNKWKFSVIRVVSSSA